MKKIFVFLSIFALMATFAGAKSLKGKGPKMNTGKPEIVDYQGLALGSKIPAWVTAIGNGESKKVAKALDIDKNSQVFILYSVGDDLEFLKIWTDQVDARAEVVNSIEQTIAQTIQTELTLKQADEQTKQKAAKIYSAGLSNLTLNGLIKEASYWILTKSKKPTVKKAKKDSDYNFKYTYYVVFSIDKEYYNKQLESAMKDIDDIDDQTAFLKEVLSKKLKETIGAEDQSFSIIEE